MVDGINIDVSGLKELSKKISKLHSGLKDLRPLFEQFSTDFYKSEKEIFNLKSPGKYQDLSKKPYFFPRKAGDLGPRGGKYKKFLMGYWEWKLYYYGFRYPILMATGKLADSLLNRGSQGSVNVITRNSLTIGTSINYGIYHHSKEPRTKIPRRPLWREEKDGPMFQRWNRITDAYLDKMIQGAFKNG